MSDTLPPKATLETATVLVFLVFLLLAGSGIFHFLAKLRAIEHGGYVECYGGGLVGNVEACTGQACEAAAAVCDKELATSLRGPAE